MGQTASMWMLFPFVLVWADITAVSEQSRYGNVLDRGDSRGHFDVCDTRQSHRHIKPNGLFLLINKGRPNSSFTNEIQPFKQKVTKETIKTSSRSKENKIKLSHHFIPKPMSGFVQQRGLSPAKLAYSHKSVHRKSKSIGKKIETLASSNQDGDFWAVRGK